MEWRSAAQLWASISAKELQTFGLVTSRSDLHARCWKSPGPAAPLFQTSAGSLWPRSAATWGRSPRGSGGGTPHAVERPEGAGGTPRDGEQTSLSAPSVEVCGTRASPGDLAKLRREAHWNSGFLARRRFWARSA